MGVLEGRREDGDRYRKAAIRVRWPAWLLGGFLALALLPSLPGAFVYDDISLIAHNHFVQNWEFAGRAFLTHFWDTSNRTPQADTLHYYRPLVTLSYLMNWQASQGSPWSFHLLNILLHIASTWLAHRLAKRWTGSQRLAWVCTAVFALHATRWESVLWIAGRPDPMMTFFLLAALELAPREETPGHRGARTGAALLSFGCALLCKEPAIAAPFLFLAGASTGGRGMLQRQRFFLGISALGSLAYLAARAAWLPVGSPGFRLTLGEGLETVGYYGARALAPWPLTFFYAPRQQGEATNWIALLGGAVMIGLLLAVALRAWRRERPALLLLLSALAFVGPLLNFTDTGSKFTTSDRFLYLPLWLVVLAACQLWRTRLHDLLEPRVTRLAAVGALSVHTLTLAAKNADLLDRHTLWTSEYAFNPQNPDALRSLSRLANGDGDHVRAIALIEESLRRPSLSYKALADPPSNALAYASLVHLKERDLPDGAFQTLRSIAQDGVDILAGKRRTHRTDLFPIDWPMDQRAAALAATNGEEILARSLAPLTSRLEQREVTLTLLDAIPDERLHLLSNPFVIVLAEAREERFERAKSRIRVMRRTRELMPELVTEPGIREAEQRIARAEALFNQSSTLAGNDARFVRARAYAELGAYFRALMQLRPLPAEYPGRAPLYLQLLVAARLEKKALLFATPLLGEPAAREQIARIRSQLPPELVAQSVPGQSL